jgi:hypothetical protein
MKIINILFYISCLTLALLAFSEIEEVNEVKLIENNIRPTNVIDMGKLITSTRLPNGYQVRYPEVVLAQTMLETGNYTSQIYVDCRNTLGMKVPYKRMGGYSVGHCRGHAKYRSIEDSVKDYLHWQSIYLPYYEDKILKRPIINVEEYLQFLKYQGYAEDAAYLNKVRGYLPAATKALDSL